MPAVAALAQRAPVPVEANISIHERLTPAIESAAYFVVAEALTNVAKYAQAENVVVDLPASATRSASWSRTTASAARDIETGTGLRGLVDRLSALDGTLELETPEGGGTRLIARIPCAADDLIAEATDDAAPGRRRRQAMRRGPARWRAAPARARARRAAARSPRSASPTSSRARASSPPRPRTARAPNGAGSIRIAVVTHGAAASAFWAIVKNGVDAAARQMTSRSPTARPTPSASTRMKDLIYEAVDSQPDGLVVSIPDPAVAPAIRRAERAGIPVVSINSGANAVARASACSRTSASARRPPATRSASAWRPPASSARCASSRSCATTRSTSAAPASRAGCARAAGRARNFVPRRHRSQHRRAQARRPSSRRGRPTAS